MNCWIITIVVNSGKFEHLSSSVSCIAFAGRTFWLIKMKQICLLNIKHFCLDFIEVYLKTNLEIPCYDYTMVCKDDKIFLCRLFIISNNIFIRVCHDNVRVMENIKKCQCKRLAKVSFCTFWKSDSVFTQFLSTSSSSSW